jgi:head-tail joining protein
MDIGSLRHTMTIQAPLGVLSETLPVDVDTSVPMAIAVLPLQFQARERLDAGGLQTQTLYTVTCRYREDVRPAYVLLEQCCTLRRFQILSIIPGDRRDVLDMTCVTAG